MAMSSQPGGKGTGAFGTTSVVLTCTKHRTIWFASASALEGHAVIPMVAVGIFFPSWQAIETDIWRGKTDA